MKGTFVHEQIEYRFEIAKDGFEQGDSVPCTLTVKNHTAVSRNISDLRLVLAVGPSARSKTNIEEEFETISSADLKLPWAIEPQSQQSCDWTFTLDKNCPISDNSRTPYIRCVATAGVVNQLPLAVQAHPHIRLVIRALETTFQFVLKSEKSSKNRVNVKFKPPATKRFFLVDELTLGACFDGEALILHFTFSVKQFASEGAKVGTKRAKTEVEQRLEPAQYIMPGGFVKHEAIDAAIEESLKAVASGL